jgi:hypothetical protein
MRILLQAPGDDPPDAAADIMPNRWSLAVL